MAGTKLEISWSSLWRVFTMFLFVLILYFVRDVVIIVLLAIVISSAIHGPVEYLEKKRVPRVLGVLIIFLIGLSLLALALYVLIPVILIQFKYLLVNINNLKAPILDVFGTSEIVSKISENISVIIDTLFYGGAGVASFVAKFIGNIFFVGVSLILSFYLAMSKDGVEKFIRAILPISLEDYAASLYRRTRSKLSRWLGGQIVLSVFIGILTFIGLSILGVEYALMLSVLAMILELVPYVGPIAVGAISFLTVLPQSFTLALMVVLLFFIIQQIENHILVPLIISRAIGAEPVVVVIAVLAGSQLAGFYGILLAVPVAIFIQELVEDWGSRKSNLRDKLAKLTTQ